mgnify:CR=1 FL=1
MIKNVMRVTTAFIALFFSTQLIAAEDSKNLFTSSEWALGTYWTSGDGGMMPVLSVQYNMIGFAFGMTVDHNREYTNEAGETVAGGSEFDYLFDFSLRSPISPRLFFKYGASLQYGHSNLEGVKDPYVFGPFVGLSYYLTDHLCLEATLLPYAYERYTDDTKEDEFMKNGRIGVSYVF